MGRLAVLLTLAVVSASTGCGANDQEIQTTTSALLQNTAYRGVTLLGGTDVGAAMFNNGSTNYAYLAFVNTDNTIGIIAEQNLGDFTGQSYFKYTLSNFKTNYGPALISYNGFLYMFFVGLDRKFYLARSPDGGANSWVGPELINWDNFDTTGFEYRPAPVVFNGTLIVFVARDLYLGCDNRNRLYQYNVTPGGLSASGPYDVGDIVYTNHTPAAAVFNGNLYLAWTDEYDESCLDGSQMMYMKWFDPLVGNWTQEHFIPNNWGQPSLFALNSLLALIYRGTDGHIYKAYTNGATTGGGEMSFSPPTKANGSTTNHPPAPFLATGSSPLNDVWVLYPGTNNSLYTALQ